MIDFVVGEHVFEAKPLSYPVAGGIFIRQASQENRLSGILYEASIYDNIGIFMGLCNVPDYKDEDAKINFHSFKIKAIEYNNVIKNVISRRVKDPIIIDKDLSNCYKMLQVERERLLLIDEDYKIVGYATSSHSLFYRADLLITRLNYSELFYVEKNSIKWV